MINIEDRIVLAEGHVYPNDSELTHINKNVLIVGSTGSGKTLSNVIPTLLKTYNSSVVVSFTKAKYIKPLEKRFLDKGYKVKIIDLFDGNYSTVGYDPLTNINDDEDVSNLANIIIGDPGAHADPFWNDSASSILAGLIHLELLNAKEAYRLPSFANVIDLVNTINIFSGGEDSEICTSFDNYFEYIEKNYIDNPASEFYRLLLNCPIRTANCVLATLKSKVSKYNTIGIINSSKCEEIIDFARLGDEKTALFIRTSPVNSALQEYVNIMYSDIIRVLFEHAEENENMCLNIPVNIYCDDFACGGTIPNFDRYISIFRGVGISATILLQSISQLSSMYGESAACTILNNIDTYVYTGSVDKDTCETVAMKLNRPYTEILQLPLETFVIHRRGYKPVEAHRYRTLEDPLYIEMMQN